MKCQSRFLGEKDKYFSMSSAENFTQRANRYRLKRFIVFKSFFVYEQSIVAHSVFKSCDCCHDNDITDTPN